MKYWNKRKNCRENWTLIQLPFSPNYYKYWGKWTDAKIWCQQHESPYRFYSGRYISDVWYFENSEDALVFKLKFQGK